MQSSNEQKHESTNPLQRALIARLQRQVVRHLADLGARSVLDVGCGEGYLARALLDALPGIALEGVDASEAAIAAARRRCPTARFERLGLDELAGSGRRWEMVVCSEVLEHLTAPRAALDTLRSLTTGHALLTVPWEPWFRLANLLRGRYLATRGNHPEHVQHWGLRAFIAEAGRAFTLVDASVSFPWIVYLGRPRDGERCAP